MKDSKPTQLATTPEFTSEFGLFFAIWSGAEMTLDFGIGKFLDIPYEETHLITAGADFNRKARLLQALVKRKNPPRANDIISALRTIQNESLRNTFSHSYYTGGSKGRPDTVEFVERSRYGSYDPRVHVFTLSQFKDHVEKLLVASNQLLDSIGISREELQKFVDTATHAAHTA